MLKLDNINVYYGDVQVLFDVSLEVNEGEVVALVGANAAGKSTTINAISGIVPISSGKIIFRGEEVTNSSPHLLVSKGLIQVAEGRRLFPYLTVLENLELGAYLPKNREKVNESLEMVYEMFPILNERKTQLAHQFSGGEQQMLAIARSLMSNPYLLMLDEPSLGLSPKLTLQVFNIVKEIQNRGMTVLLVEQNVTQALKLSDRAYVLENGRITMSGPSDEIIEDPHLKKAYLGI